MPWIQTIPPEAAAGELAQLYEGIAAARGGIAEVHRVQSLHPRAMRAHLELYRAVLFGRSSLARVTRERIAVVVSATNRCAYCVAHHAEALRQLGDPPEVVDALAADTIPANLTSAEAEVLRWARTAVSEPHASGEAGVSSLRAAGLDDRGVLDAALTVAYFSFVNRVVLLLGVETEHGFEQTCGADRAPLARSGPPPPSPGVG